MEQLSEKIVILTGAGQGIGKWIMLVVLFAIAAWMIYKKQIGDMQFNFVLCLLAANVSSLLENVAFWVRIVLFLLVFAGGYFVAKTFKKKRES